MKAKKDKVLKKKKLKRKKWNAFIQDNNIFQDKKKKKQEEIIHICRHNHFYAFNWLYVAGCNLQTAK